MSLKVFNAYKLPVEMAYDSSKLMAFLNGIRGKYLDHLFSKVDVDAAKRIVSCIEHHKKKDYEGCEVGSYLFFERYISEQSRTDRRGIVWDCSGNCTIIHHSATCILWLFPGQEMSMYLRDSDVLSAFKRYDYSDHDGYPVEISEFWESLFAARREDVPADLGLGYEFWRETDAYDLADRLADVWETQKPPQVSRVDWDGSPMEPSPEEIAFKLENGMNMEG